MLLFLALTIAVALLAAATYPLSQNTVTAPNLHAYAGGTTSISGAVVDMANFDAIQVTLDIGAITAGAGVELQLQGSPFANGTSNVTEATTGNIPLGSGNVAMVLDVIRPTNRYVFPLVIRSTQNSAIQSVTTIQYAPRSAPEAAGGNVSCQTLAIVN